jgi:hypothetical protein
MHRRDYTAGRWHLIARRWPSRHGLRWSLDLWSNPQHPNRWTLDICAGTRMWTLRRTTI